MAEQEIRQERSWSIPRARRRLVFRVVRNDGTEAFWATTSRQGELEVRDAWHVVTALLDDGGVLDDVRSIEILTRVVELEVEPRD